MDSTDHIPPVKLFHYRIHAMPLDAEELRHLAECPECRAVIDEFETYIAPGVISAA